MTPDRPLRLRPGVVIAITMAAIMFGGPVLFPDAPLPVGMIGGMVGALLVFVWWMFFSRAAWVERVGVIAVMVVALLVTRQFVHISIAGAGQGMLIYFLPVPYFALALVAWAAATRHLASGTRRALMVVPAVIVCAPFLLIRTPGVMGSAGMIFHWRWTPTPEELLLAKGEADPKPLPPPPPVAVVDTPAAPATVDAKPAEASAPSAPKAPEAPLAPLTPVAPSAEWPGFRGPNRDSVIRNVRVNTDWSASPPVELWRRAVGPGWSSFAVQGDFIYTQEQRGDDEVVAAYKLSTGEPLWRHRDPVRFYESNGGAGPRATPTLDHGRVYTSGATGILNALDARTGALLWSHNLAVEAKVDTPIWGFSASPLVIGDIVIAAASGVLAGYDRLTGERRWLNPSKGGSYSSPHRATIDGVEQVVLLGGPGVMSVSPADGKLLWEHKWDGGAIVQPALTEDGVVANSISMTGGVGTRRLTVKQASGGWTVEERWTSNGLKPYFNDFVLHKGHAYGFDNSILSCIDLADGKRKWKGGRYGNGQLVLLADQDVLLVLSEEGELALVSATTDGFKELAKVPALNAKTWNHPVLVGDTLLVRNGEEMAAFKLAMERPQPTER